MRELSKAYYQNHFQLGEYRIRRKVILDKIDEEFNGRKDEMVEGSSSNYMNTVVPSLYVLIVYVLHILHLYQAEIKCDSHIRI